MYYVKTKKGQSVADRCNIGSIYASMGDKIHHDDISQVAAILDMTPSGMDLLYELEDVAEDYVQELGFDF